MHAALVTSFEDPPSYQDVPEPVAGPGDVVLTMLAAGLHPRVRSQAGGSHYTSTGELPLIPGVDGVGRRSDDSLAYVVLPDGRWGSMAERVVVDPRRTITLPYDADPVAVAAGMNPAMSSWLALRRRISLQPGQDVLVLGATGNAGQLAVRIAKHLGARRVIAAGRDPVRLALLPGLGADEVISLSGERDEVTAHLARVAADVDVVLDYLWGSLTQDLIAPVVTGRRDPGKALDWVQIGSMAGSTINLPAAALRAANLRFLGSGQGSLAPAGILEELAELARLICAGALTVVTRAVPLSQVRRAWTTPATPGERVVIVP